MTNRLSGGGSARLIGVLLLCLATSLAWADILYVHTDHLNTPRLASNEQGVTVWRNLPTGEPFGNSPVEEDPDGDSTLNTLNLRFPGQYADKETNLHYNYHRWYDPGAGRYTTADPLGIEGGDLSLYLYAKNNPLSYIDPLGLFVPAVHSEITRNATRGTKCQAKAGAIAQAVVNADFSPGSQLVRNARQHAMSVPGESPTEAQANTQQFIEKGLKSCTLQGLAEALHAAQDKYSGSHAGYQPWGGGRPTLWHMIQDTFLGKGSPARAEAESRQLINQFVKMCPCICD